MIQFLNEGIGLIYLLQVIIMIWVLWTFHKRIQFINQSTNEVGAKLLRAVEILKDQVAALTAADQLLNKEIYDLTKGKE